MKKVIAIVLILLVLGAAAWLILLRPSDYTEESAAALFEAKKSSFVTMAEYLADNNIDAVIDGLLSIDNRYGVPMVSENRYRAFNDANTELMRESIVKIRSVGGRVEFVLSDEGGLLNRMNVSIVYSKNGGSDSSAKPLSEKNWYLYMEK